MASYFPNGTTLAETFAGHDLPVSEIAQIIVKRLSK
jgi:hypothetical protein